MIKNKLDFKLINLALIMVIIYLIYHTGNLWMGVVNTIFKIVTPFFFAFVLAYALHPILRYFLKKKIPKGIGVFIIIACLLGGIGVLGVMVAPLLFGQLSSLFNGIIAFLKEISINYDINLGDIQTSLSDIFNDIIMKLGKYLSDGAISVIGVSINYLSILFIAFSAAIYFLLDMDKIRNKVKKYLLSKSKKTYLYVRRLDNEMKNYLIGFMKIIFISWIEYTLAFTVIGHPNAMLLGVLAALGNLIPYFGGIITNIIAAITAFVISPSLFLKTIIAFIILSNIDGYLINPLVYGKSNQIHPLIVILSVFAGGILFGMMGIIISLPLSILLITTYKFYRDDIAEKIDDIKIISKEK